MLLLQLEFKCSQVRDRFVQGEFKVLSTQLSKYWIFYWTLNYGFIPNFKANVVLGTLLTRVNNLPTWFTTIWTMLKTLDCSAQKSAENFGTERSAGQRPARNWKKIFRCQKLFAREYREKLKKIFSQFQNLIRKLKWKNGSRRLNIGKTYLIFGTVSF